MKVAVLHVTRTKVTPEQYGLLTESSNVAITKYVASNTSETEAIVFHNFFINSGQTWDEVKAVIEEINQQNYGGLLLWLTPDVVKLKFYGQRIVEFVILNSKTKSKFNLLQQSDLFGPLKKGLDIHRFGIPALA